MDEIKCEHCNDENLQILEYGKYKCLKCNKTTIIKEEIQSFIICPKCKEIYLIKMRLVTHSIYCPKCYHAQLT